MRPVLHGAAQRLNTLHLVHFCSTRYAKVLREGAASRSHPVLKASNTRHYTRQVIKAAGLEYGYLGIDWAKHVNSPTRQLAVNIWALQMVSADKAAANIWQGNLASVARSCGGCHGNVC